MNETEKFNQAVREFSDAVIEAFRPLAEAVRSLVSVVLDQVDRLPYRNSGLRFPTNRTRTRRSRVRSSTRNPDKTPNRSGSSRENRPGIGPRGSR